MLEKLRRPLRTNKPRLGCAVVGLPTIPVLACMAGLVAGLVPTPDPIPEEAVLATYDAEVSTLTELGFTPQGEHLYEHVGPGQGEGTHAEELTLEPRTCVAAVGAVFGTEVVEQLRVRMVAPETLELATDEPRGYVAHAQWCSDGEPTTVRVELEYRPPASFSHPEVNGGARIGLFTVPSDRLGGLRGVTRGELSRDAMRSADDAIVAQADAHRPDGRLIGELEVMRDAARLVPEEEATYAVLYLGALNATSDLVNPRITTLSEDVPAGWRPGAHHTQDALRQTQDPDDPDGVHDPLFWVDSEGPYRALAVIEPEALGEGCLRVQLVRRLFGYEIPALHRVNAATDHMSELSTTENYATDRICTGTYVYLASPGDHEHYTLRFFAAD